MGATFLVWGAALVVAALVVWVVVGLAGSTMPFRTRVGPSTDDDQTLRYVVREGQDPAVVISAVMERGFTARVDSEGGTGERVVIVACPNGESDREQVREAIAEAGTSMDDPALTAHPVRFVDEA
jgi:hypothetical protein